MKISLNRKSAGTALLLLYLLACSNIHGQEYIIRNFTSQTGLSHNNIRSIVRDSTGFLWLATWDGISRYDGYTFKNYYHIPNDTTSLQYFSVRELKVDKYNNLWVYSDQRVLEKFDRSSDNFQLIREIGGIKLDYVSMISTDNDGLLIIITRDKIIKWDERNQKASIHELIDIDNNAFVPEETFFYNVLEYRDDLWIAGYMILHFRKASDNKYVFIKKYQIKEPYNRRIDFDFYKWYKIKISEKGTKWIFSNTGLYRLDPKTDEFILHRDKIPHGEFKGNELLYWGGFNDGISIFKPETSDLINIPQGLTGSPMGMMSDSDKTFWFSGTSAKGVAQGLSHLIFTSGFFRNVLLTDPDSTGQAIFSLAVDNQKNTWIGIRGNDDITVMSEDGKISSKGRLSKEEIAEAGHIRSMRNTPEGIWIGYYMKLIRFFAYSDGKFHDYFLKVPVCRTIMPINNKVVIALTNSFIFDPLKGKTDTLWKSGTNMATYKLLTDSTGILWGAMSKGTLSRVNPETGEGRMIQIPPGQSNIEDIIISHDGYFWLAMLGDGVCRYNSSTGEYKYYTTENGLSNNTTYNLYEDRSGNIWVSTNIGISRINPETGQIRAFGVDDGLKIHEFNSGAKFRTDDGEFMFGGMDGFVRFYPDSLDTKTDYGPLQKIILTDFRVSGLKRLLPDAINDSDTIILKPGENNFHLSFSSSDFRNSENKRYRYKLSPVNDEWIETGSDNRSLNYSNLRPGYYTLSIEPNDINGNWTGARQMVFRVQPHFFQTKAFMIGMPFLLILLSISMIILYIRQVKFREKQKQETLRLHALQGQMNPHFIFNSLNSINYFISNNDKLSANRYIADFARLIRSILHNMNHNYISIGDEIESIEEYLKIEHLRFGDKFNYEISVDSNINPDETKVSPGLVQPFIENAIWHGVRGLEQRKGFIKIKFGLSEGKLVCSIEDDGIGRKRSTDMKSKDDMKISKGISLISERLKILSSLHSRNYKLVIEDLHPGKADTGTRVVLDVPFEKN